MRFVMFFITMCFLGAVLFGAVARADAHLPLRGMRSRASAAAIKNKLIKAKFNLKRLEAEIAERESDQGVMDGIMPHDEYVGGSFFENNLEENQDFLVKLRKKRVQIARAIEFYERKYGFGPEIYNNRAMADNSAPW